jgi:hypothetical protein
MVGRFPRAFPPTFSLSLFFFWPVPDSLTPKICMRAGLDGG